MGPELGLILAPLRILDPDIRLRLSQPTRPVPGPGNIIDLILFLLLI